VNAKCARVVTDKCDNIANQAVHPAKCLASGINGLGGGGGGGGGGLAGKKLSKT